MIHLTSFLHTMSLYANRWGGPRYRTEELAKFLNKHLYNIQEDQLKEGKKVNLCLSHDAFLSSNHTPLYASSIQYIGKKNAYKIKDELGFEAVFDEGTEILTYIDHPEFGPLEWLPIESCSAGIYRVINFELVDALKNDKIDHHLPFTDSFLSIKYNSDKEAQTILCDGLSSMMLLKKENGTIKKLDKFDSNNIQEVYLSKIMEIECIEQLPFFRIEFNPFCYALQKNRKLSNKSKNRYHKYRLDTRTNRWLEKMRSKVFSMKKSKIDFIFELKHMEKS